ncbi:AAA family ATPase [Amycolatopsis samaneae]|uniref:AAA family ATPase n=1 Tax=Amycolatopsis samaneae TaxID=664691 RepID=A0ABW5GH66_9PSEU
MNDGYSDSAEHLAAELARADRLVRAQVLWFRHELGRLKPADQWGLPSVGEAEVDAYLAAEGPPEPPPEVVAELTAAHDEAEEIAARVRVTTVPLRLSTLVERCGLSGAERDLVLLCLLPGTDGRYRRLFGYLADDATVTGPTRELAARIVPGPSPLSATGPLVRHQLIVDGPGGLRLDRRIAGFLTGDDTADDRVADVLTVASPGPSLDELVLDPAMRARLRELARALDERAFVLLHGPYGAGRRTLAAALCHETGRPLLYAHVTDPSRVDLCRREALLRGAALCWVDADPALGVDRANPGLTFATAETPWDPAGQGTGSGFLRVDLPAPGYGPRRDLWLAMLPPDAELDTPPRKVLAELLANTFQLTAGQIADAIGSARGAAKVRAPGTAALSQDDLYEGCRRQAARRLVAFARRIEPRTELGFDDLVLPTANRVQLDELRARITLRSKVFSELGFDRRLSLGRGVVAMFTGGSGTGKTMAAELLAREQGADLYKVDLSAVASKYVGETEKNLDRVFADAEQTNAMIFFDEADALFAKRGEVKEAKDRWANVEMAFLLQRVEEFSGVVVLASNLRQNIDTAFLRRLHAIVDFPPPDAHARLRIWRGMFPDAVTAPGTDELSRLAERFSLSGGSIKNVVLDAAFRALRADPAATAVSLRELVLSVGREYQKLGLPITPGGFGTPFYEWFGEELLHG